MNRLLGALDHHWFDPAPLRDLAIVRIVLAAAGTWFLLLVGDPLGCAAELLRAPAADYMPLPALKVVLLPFGWGYRPSMELLTAVWTIGIIGGALAVTGLSARSGMLLLAIAGTVMVGHRFSYGELHHPEAALVIMLWVMATTPSGRALSLRALGPRDRGLERSMHARWPLRLGQWLLVLIYFSAATSKLHAAGLDWMNGTTLSYYLARDGVLWDAPLGVWLSQYGWLTQILAAGTIAFELTLAAAVLVPRLTWVYLLTGAMLHTGIYLTQRAPFFALMAVYIVFIVEVRSHLPRPIARRTAAAHV